MIRALKQRLFQIARDDNHSFKDRLRPFLPRRGSRSAVEQLRHFILVFPDIISQIQAWADHSDMTPPLKRLNGFVLTYIYHPGDFMPDDSNGLFGYLDDAYFVGRAAEEIIKHLGKKARPTFPIFQDIEPQLSKWIKLTKRVIPVEARNVDKMLEELVSGRQEAFEAAIA